MRLDLLTFRRMSLADLDAVCAIDAVSFPSPWSRGMFENEIAKQEAYYFVAERHAEERPPQIVGYGGANFVASDVGSCGDECHIVILAAHPDFRRRKLGARFLLHLLDEALSRGAKRFTLEVRTGNEAAIRLYEKFGFIGVALRKNYYRNEGQDALIMWIHDGTSDAIRSRWREIREELRAASCS